MWFWNGRKKPESTFLATLREIDHFKKLVAEQTCLGCDQKTLELVNFTRNEKDVESKAKGWQAQVTCKNCRIFGTVNSEGFDFVRINSKGRARE